MPKPPAEDRKDASKPKRQMFGKYEVKKLIGKGGMGSVHLATDTELKRTVALKILPKSRAENPTLVARFKAEGQAAAVLNHENIVRVYEAGEINGQLYMALEYVDGTDAHKVLQKRGAMPVKRSIEVVRGVAKALAHAATHGIVHRDIKPANLLVKPDGAVKLADMGLARSLADEEDAGITRAGTTVGTVDFMSPEQARDSKSADLRSDIYSLGATWFQLLTTRVPFPDGDLTNKLRSHALAARPDPADWNPQVPEEVSAVLARMMAVKPEDRYQTVDDLLEDLDGLSKRKKQRVSEIFEDDSADGLAIDRIRAAESSASSAAVVAPTRGRRQKDAAGRDDLFDELPDLEESAEIAAAPVRPATPKKRRRSGSGSPGREPAARTREVAAAPEEATSSGTVASVAAPQKRSSKQSRRSRSSEGPPAVAEAVTANAPAARKKGAAAESNEQSGQPNKTSKQITKAGLPPRKGGGVSVESGSGGPRVGWGRIAAVLGGLGVAAAAAVFGPSLFGGGDAEPIAPPPGVDLAAAANATDAAADNAPEDDPLGPNAVSGLPPEFAALSPEEFERLKNLPPLTRRPGNDTPPWAEVARLGLDRPPNVVTVRPGGGSGTVASLADALAKLPATGGSVELPDRGPYFLDATKLSSAARVDIRGTGGRPVVYFVADDREAGTAGRAWLDAENCRLSLSGLDIVAGPNVGTNGTSLVRVHRGTLTVLDCSITSLGANRVTALEVTDGSGPLKSRAETGRVCVVDTAFYSAAMTALETDAPGFDVVFGNCYVGSGESPAVRLNARDVPDAATDGRLAVLGSTVVSGAEAVLVTPVVGNPAVEVRMQQSLIAREVGGSGPAVRADDAEFVTVDTDRSILTGWSPLAAVDGRILDSASDWTAAFGRPLRTQQVHETPLPPAGVAARSQTPADLTPRWSESIETSVGYDLLAADASRLSSPPEGAVRRLVARSGFPPWPDPFEPAPATARYEPQRDGDFGRYLGGLPDGSVVEVPAGQHRLTRVTLYGRSLTLRGEDAGTFIEPMRPRRGRMDAAFEIGDGGDLTLERLTLAVPADLGKVAPERLIELRGGSLTTDRVTIADRTDASDGRLIDGSGTLLLRLSLLTTGGTAIGASGEVRGVLEGSAVVGRVGIDGPAAFSIRRSTVAASERLTGPYAAVWSQDSVYAGSGSIDLPKTPRWYGRGDAFAGTLSLRPADGPAVPLKSAAVWRDTVGGFAAVDVAAGDAVRLQSPLSPPHEVQPDDLRLARSVGTNIGVDSGDLGGPATGSPARRPAGGGLSF